MAPYPRSLVVFLSGTRRDLGPFFTEAAAKINATRRYSASSMDDSAPEGVPIDRWSRREAIRADVLVGLVGNYYGAVPPGNTKSLTEQEYEMARQVGVEPLMFLTDAGDATVIAAQDALARERVANFRDRINRECSREIVNDAAAFADRALHALDGWVARPLGGATQSVDDYYAAMLRPDSVLGHHANLVGQAVLLETIRGFVQSQRRLLILEAPWGRGKSRLMVEFARTSAVPVRFIKNDVVPSRSNLFVTPTDPVVLVLEDAHRRDAVEVASLLEFIIRCDVTVKLVVTTRGAGPRQPITLATEAGFPASTIAVHQVPPLSDAEHRQLAREVIGGNDEAAYAIAKRTRGNALACVLASRLFRGNRLSITDIEDDSEFQVAIVETYKRLIVDEGLSAEHKQFLKLVSLVGPIRPSSNEESTPLAGFLSWPIDKLRNIADDLETRGLLLRGGGLLRIPVDAVAESELLSACVSKRGEPTGYVDRVLGALWGHSRRRMLRNLAIADWEAKRVGFKVDLLREVWPVLQKEYASSPNSGRRQLLEELEDIAWYQPERTLEFVRYALSLKTAPEEDSPFLRGLRTDVLIHDAIADLLAIAARWQPLLPAACDLLWELARDDVRPAEQNPHSAERRLKELGSYRRRTTVGHCESFVSWAERRSAGEEAIPTDRIAAYVAGLLVREAEHDWSDERSLHMSSSGIRYANVAHLRLRVLDLLQRIAQGDHGAASARAIAIMGEALVPPRGLFGRVVTDEEIRQWEDEEYDVLARIRKIREARDDRALDICILRELAWPAEHAPNNRTREGATEQAQAIRDALKGTVEFAIIAPFELDHDMAYQEEHAKAIPGIAKGLLDARKPYDELITKIVHVDTVLLSYGRSSSPSGLLSLIASLDVEAGESILGAVLSDARHVLLRSIDAIIDGLFIADPKRGASALEKSIAAGHEQALTVVACSMRSPTWVAAIGQEAVCAYLQEILAHQQPFVRNAALLTVGHGNAIDGVRRARLAVEYDVVSTPETGENWAQALVGGKLIDHCSEADCVTLSDKLRAVRKMDYWCSQLIARLCRIVPAQVVDALLARVDNAETFNRGFDAIPDFYQVDPFEGLPPDERRFGMVELGKRFDQTYVVAHAARTLFSRLGASAPDIRRDVRATWAVSGEAPLVELAAESFREEDPESLFTQEESVVDILRAAAVLSRETLENVKKDFLLLSMSGVRSGTLGEPMPRDIDLRNRAQTAVAKYIAEPIIADFYRSVADSMEATIQRDTAGFEEELI